MASNMNPGTESGRNESGVTTQDIPTLVVEQAEAAVASERDTSGESSVERRHMGRDVPIATHPDAPSDLPVTPSPPAYGQDYGTVRSEQEGFATKASVADDGRVNIRIKQQNRRLSSLLVPALRHQQDIVDHEHAPPPAYIPPSLGGDEGEAPPPPMNVVIHVVGSRGDVQPFVALGKVLKETYHHRVRLATHPNFRDFVSENGLEFFNIGGDPTALMAFMVKNPGLMPGFDSLRSGDVGNRRREVAEYLKGCWRSCYETGNGDGPEATDDTIDDLTSRGSDDSDGSSRPFVADCIIANPPSFAHIHCAEKLGIPLHVMFTMPYSPTQAFPHPLANIQSSNADPNLTNYVSYHLIDMLTWQGLGDVINNFRQKSLGLESISLMWAPGMLQRLKIPHTYCWSPALIPKPRDWGQQISISGFFFLNLATNYTPAPDLKAFLDAGPPPVYIGFGSIVLDDPNAMTQLIFEAVRITGQRVLLSKGWGGMGAEELGIPDGVFMLGNMPHDWLFQYVSCVVHHGGAGTTAAGITAGKPTVVVPFFGDQPFWGAMVARAGAGPDPLPHKELTAEKLAEAINFCLRPESQERAQELASKIAKEKGSDVGAQSFHQMLDVDKLRCTLFPSRAAVWRIRRTQVRLSTLAACTLANEGLLDFNDLKIFRPREYETEDGPWDPVTGGATAIVGTMSTMMMGIADMPIDTLKALKIHPDASKKKKSVAPGDEAEETATISTASKTPTMSGHSSNSTPGSPISSGANTPGTSQQASSTFNLQESLEKLQSQSALGNVSGVKSSSMADALRGHLGDTRPRSKSGSRSRSGSMSRGIETAIGTGKGMQKVLGAGFKSPMDFTMAVAKGFHNAPKLYGDDTVRQTDQVTNIRTGLKTAGKEFGFGLYDGITGLVTQPIKGAQKEGTSGLVKGIGKGIGGLMLKSSSAIFSIPGYTMKGIYKSIQLRFGSSVQSYIIASRTVQGFDEWQCSSAAERETIIARWNVLKNDLKKKRNPDELVRDILEEQKRKGISWTQDLISGIEQRRTRSRANTASRSRAGTVTTAPETPDRNTLHVGSPPIPPPRQPSTTNNEPPTFDDAEFEEAILRSIRETSRGIPEEDAALERAIRASMMELERGTDPAASEHDEDAELRRAINASVAEAQRQGAVNEEQDDELKRALAQSLEEHRDREGARSTARAEEAVASSSRAPAVAEAAEAPPAYDSGHLEGTTREEFNAQEKSGEGEKSQQERTEEEIVMEYVKKQSLKEEEFRQARAGREA